MRAPRATTLLLVMLLLLLASPDAFVVRSSSSLNKPPSLLSGRRRASVPSPLLSTPSGISAEEAVTNKLAEKVWDKEVPPSIEAVIEQAQASLAAALEAGERLIRVDIRTPGLDEALEQTAIREKGLLLSVVGAFFPLLANTKQAKVLFESEGEAAMAAKAFSQGGVWDIPDSLTFAGLTSRAVAPDDTVVFLVEPINRSGNPVILTVEELINAHPDKTFVLFNPDLEMKGSPTGIRERDRRQGFLDSFKSAYIYLCLATLSRPSLVPRELGALHFQYEQGRYRLLRCLLPEDGPGSLNRFFLGQKRVYETTAATPTKARPPNFYVVGEWDKRPGQEELSQAMAGAELVLEDLIREMADSIGTEEEAKAVLVEASKTRAVKPDRVLRAISFLEKASRKGGKKGPEEEEAQAKELRERIGGEWRLIFTTGDKGTQARVGRINYWPGKAVQKFSKTTPDYSNNIYLFDRPVVQVIGSFSCPLCRKLEFVVDSIKLGPFGFKSKGTGFFTFILVDEQIAVARGQGGGLALWARQQA